MAAMQLKQQSPPPREAIDFPESDGKPMGETEAHVTQIMHLVTALKRFFRHRSDVAVIANIMLYYDPTTNKKVTSPDVFVALGVDASSLRRTWKTWEEGKAPDVVFEITSRATRKEDMKDKLALYQELRVQEYFLYDPLDEYLRPPLQGYRLVEGRYERIDSKPLVSQVLGVELHRRGRWLRLYDPVQKAWLLTPEEIDEARAEAEARAQALEAEVARLREELARRGG
jgi:Uma2 family endonuclease